MPNEGHDRRDPRWPADARIGPATAGNGGTVAKLLVSPAINEDFAADVFAAREAAVSEAPAWPGAHDFVIAATAVATGRVVLTGDRSARFGDVPGIECIHVAVTAMPVTDRPPGSA